MTRWILALAGLAALAAGGCFRLEQDLTLNADGSADVKLRYGMSEQSIARLEAMKKVAESNPNAKVQVNNPNLIFDESRIRADFGQRKNEKKDEGLELRNCRTESRDGWKYATLELRCQDMAAAGKAAEALGTKGGYSLTKNADGNYVLEMYGVKPPASEPPGDKADPQAKAQKQEKTRALMAGLRIAVKVNLPGEVIDTTAPEKDKRSVSWVLDINDPAFFEKGEEMEKKGVKVTFSGKGLDLKEFKPAARKDENAPAKDAEPK
jgi:hypothetical protein